MANLNYFQWMTKNTITEWTNDSAIDTELERGLADGACGATTNPPLSYEGLVTDKHLYRDDLARLSRDCSDDEFVIEAMGLVVRRIAKRLLPIHKERGGYYGCVRAQVQPGLRDDAEGMLRMGGIFASWGENIMVKIDGSDDDLLTFLGHAPNPCPLRGITPT